MFCSIIIPTIGRSTLSQTVHSVLAQTFTADEFEVIVVNDSGQPLVKADWQNSDQVRIVDTNRRERCFARNAGAAIAKGKYLHFLDDDDWLLPDALENLWQLARASDADWLYGRTQLVDLESGRKVTLYLGLSGNCFAQAMAGEWIPLKASLIKTETFFGVGGFDPLVVIGEDKNLCQRIALRGQFACAPTTIVVVTRRGKDTVSYPLGWARECREREKILGETGAFTRMRESASSDYWHGRLVRTYITSTLWNLRQQRVLTAVGRAIFGLAGFILAGRHLFAPNFWRAVTKSHTSRIVK